MNRCPWCLGTEEMTLYHDTEWGVPLHDDDRLFEYLSLEALQCGLSWGYIMKKRKVFRRAFADFDVRAVARFTPEDMERVLNLPGMLRSPRKIAAVVHNAQMTVALQEECGSLSAWLWGFTGGKTVVYPAHAAQGLPAKTALSESMAAALKKRGFQYLGAVTIYAFLQSCGMVNDHLEGCDLREALLRGREVLLLHSDAELPPC